MNAKYHQISKSLIMRWKILKPFKHNYKKIEAIESHWNKAIENLSRGLGRPIDRPIITMNYQRLNAMN